MSTKPSRSDHLKLVPPAGTPLMPLSAEAQERVEHVERIAFDHARRARRSLEDSADAAHDIVLRFLPQFHADPDFLSDEGQRIAYTQEAVTNWFKDGWR